nr:EOG090X03DI [Eurycercus lamellatus]
MLDFENQMFLDVLNEDGLVIAAKGIGMDSVFINLLKVYSDQGNLVLVLGTSGKEEDFFIRELDSMGVKPLPKFLTSEYSVNDRQSVYMEGGVIFSSSRILVVDMLMDRMPIDLITGVMVYKAHKVIETSQEAFILRLFRQKNKKGFIKAFSSSPVSFTRGFSQVSRVMKSLFVRNLFLWPRFHGTIQSTLKEHQPDVIELRLPLTSSLLTIQTAVLDLIQFTVKELRRINPSLDLDEMTVENALSKCFRKIIKFQLEPVWHQLSGKTKQLIEDLGTLRTILVSLTQYDCVTFNVVVKSLQTTEQALKSSGWMLLDAAENLFVTSKARVYGTSLESAEPVLEENPKWTALSEVMKEIEFEISGRGQEFPTIKTLIVADDDRTCHQLRQILELGSREFLLQLHHKTKEDRLGLQRKTEAEKAEPSVEKVDQSVIVQSLRSHSDPYALHRTLYKLKPRFIIMYDCDMTFVRQVEVYQASNNENTIRVYFLVYDGSAEEQAYLTNLRREKEAFEMLIREKATMVIPEDREGRHDDNAEFLRDPRKASEMALKPLDTRLTTGKDVRQVVIVDMREFRSELPSLLHRRGIDIMPITVEVGDYILTPDICVERKSLSDLIGSLNNGRLYNQSQEMCRHYAKPMLLIEFEHDKPFALQGKYYLSNDDASLTDVTSRLQLLTLHFPKLRIIWSPGPYATAEIFETLKKGRDQPDPVKAASFSSDAYTEKNAEKYNPAIHDFVSKLPGINSKNIRRVLNRVQDLGQLLALSEWLFLDERAAVFTRGAANAGVFQPNPEDADAPRGALFRVAGTYDTSEWTQRQPMTYWINRSVVGDRTDVYTSNIVRWVPAESSDLHRLTQFLQGKYKIGPNEASYMANELEGIQDDVPNFAGLWVRLMSLAEALAYGQVGRRWAVVPAAAQCVQVWPQPSESGMDNKDWAAFVTHRLYCLAVFRRCFSDTLILALRLSESRYGYLMGDVDIGNKEAEIELNFRSGHRPSIDHEQLWVSGWHMMASLFGSPPAGPEQHNLNLRVPMSFDMRLPSTMPVAFSGQARAFAVAWTGVAGGNLSKRAASALDQLADSPTHFSNWSSRVAGIGTSEFAGIISRFAAVASCRAVFALQLSFDDTQTIHIALVTASLSRPSDHTFDTGLMIAHGIDWTSYGINEAKLVLHGMVPWPCSLRMQWGDGGLLHDQDPTAAPVSELATHGGMFPVYLVTALGRKMAREATEEIDIVTEPLGAVLVDGYFPFHGWDTKRYMGDFIFSARGNRMFSWAFSSLDRVRVSQPAPCRPLTSDMVAAEELNTILENSINAKELWNALHSSQHLAAKEAEPLGKKGKRWRGKGWKK